MGAETRNVRGGRFRSSRSGSFAQLDTRTSAAMDKTIHARDRVLLPKGIQFAPRSGDTGRLWSGTGTWGPRKSTKVPPRLSTDFVPALGLTRGDRGAKRANEKGRRGNPAALSR